MESGELLDFWFAPDHRRFWFRSTAAFDQLVSERFLTLWQAARRGELEGWQSSAEGALALVILCDQLPLHLFRGKAEGFATEAQARQVADFAIARGYDREVAREAQPFFYLPFMHSESLADQERSVALFTAAGLEENLRWARHHRALIERFGRFPHRNAILGRPSSEEERAYLAAKGSFKG